MLLHNIIKCCSHLHIFFLLLITLIYYLLYINRSGIYYMHIILAFETESEAKTPSFSFFAQLVNDSIFFKKT